MITQMPMKGVRELKAALDRKGKAIERAVMRATMKSAMLVQSRARQRIMKGPKSGTVYNRGTKSHQASAPGEAPANDTGNLVKNLTVVKGQFTNGIANAEIQVRTDYAAALEYGTLDGSIEERPYLRPSMEESRAEMQQILRDEVAAASKQ